LATIEEMTMPDSTVGSTLILLVYDDLAAAHEYLVRVFGLAAGPIQHDDKGHVVHAEVRTGDQVIWLHWRVTATGLRGSSAPRRP
jgi:MerR family transcriptional regulator, thiopeptide resistance regulator